MSKESHKMRQSENRAVERPLFGGMTPYRKRLIVRGGIWQRRDTDSAPNSETIHLDHQTYRKHMNVQKKKQPIQLLRALLAPALVVAFFPNAQAQAVISSLPTTIAQPGSYKLMASLNYNAGTGAAITVAANNCTIDLNDYVITNLTAGNSTKAIGVSALGYDNLTVRNGDIVGFYVGVDLEGHAVATKTPAQSTSPLLEHLRFTYEINRAVIVIQYRNAVVRDCQISYIGYDPSGKLVNQAIGIEDQSGFGNLYTSNQFCHISGFGLALGVNDVADNNVFSDMPFAILGVGSKIKNNTGTSIALTAYQSCTELPGTNF